MQEEWGGLQVRKAVLETHGYFVLQGGKGLTKGSPRK